MADDFYTDDNGVVRPINGKPKSKGGGPALAVVLVVALGTGGTAVGVSASGGSVSSASASSSSSGARSSQARQRSSLNVKLRLEQRGFRVESRFDRSADCVARSYGAVREFFRDEPCTGVSRALFEVHDRRKNVVLVAVAWVEMPGSASARQFHDLVDRPGTGNVTELSRDQGRYRNVRFSGEHYASRRDGTTVVNVQAQPVGRAAVAAGLVEIVADAAR